MPPVTPSEPPMAKCLMVDGRMLLWFNAGVEDSVEPIYSVLNTAAGLPIACMPVSSNRSSLAPTAAITDVQQSTSDCARSKNDGGVVQHHRSNSRLPRKSQSPHQRLQQQQQQPELPPVSHLSGMSDMVSCQVCL